MVENEHAADCPEHFLWVFHPDSALGYFTVIEKARLRELAYEGVAPDDDVEQLLVDNPKWLRIYLKHVIGQWPITIRPDQPLPEWNAAGFEDMNELFGANG